MKKSTSKKPSPTRKKVAAPPSTTGKKTAAILFGGALLVGLAVGFLWPLLFNHKIQEPSTTPPAPQGQPPKITPSFTDVTQQAGIVFQHDAGSSGHYYYPEVMGAGCAVFDADGDGLLDIYFVNGNRLPPDPPSPAITNKLYKNQGDGTFSDITEHSGAGDTAYGQGCCAADYDGDGDQDLFVTNYGPNVFYRNQGRGIFEKVPDMCADDGWGQSCAFFDADLDGDLDLYLQNYIVYKLEDAEAWYVTIGNEKVLDYCGPSGYIGQQDRFYRNAGDGTLVDDTEGSGIILPKGTGMGLVCADFDDDGDPDVVVTNDSRPNFFLRNNGQGRFTDDALSMGIAYNREGGMEAFMGVDAGDFDGDGHLDLAVPCLSTEGFSLFKNCGTYFTDISLTTGIEAATSAVTGFSPVFLDYDSDGDLDLFFTTGEVRMGRTSPTVGKTLQERYAMQDVLLENRDGRFVNITAAAGAALAQRAISRACAAFDYDNDGDTDLLITAMNGKARLLRNDTQGGHWIGFQLTGPAPNS